MYVEFITENTRTSLKIFANQIIMYFLHNICMPAYSVHETRPVTHTLYHTHHYTNSKNNIPDLNLYKEITLKTIIDKYVSHLLLWMQKTIYK